MKTISTTISLDEGVFNIVKKIKSENNKKFRSLLTKAVSTATKLSLPPYCNTTVKYQRLRGSAKRLHISLSIDAYEVLTDARSAGKVSVSAMIVAALNLLLSTSSSEGSQVADSYQIIDYQYSRFDSKNTVIVMIRYQKE